MRLSSLFDFIPDKTTVWLTPIWTLSVGVALGLLILLAIWGAIHLFSRQAGRDAPAAMLEGPLRPIFYLMLFLAGFSVLGIVAVKKPGAIISSVFRLPFTGPSAEAFALDASREEQTVRLGFYRDELQWIAFQADKPLTIDTRNPDDEEVGGVRTEVPVGRQLVYVKGQPFVKPFVSEYVDEIRVRNANGVPATLIVDLETAPVAGREVMLIPLAALCVLCLFGLYLLQRTLLPKLSAIALATSKTEMAQPLFLICVVLGAFAIATFVWIPYNTFGEDIKMLKNTGLATMMVLGLIVAMWAASSSIADEVDGRTALTVLSKPVSRRQFILGKYVGILWVVAVLFVILGLVFLICVAYKPVYDARESAAETPQWQECLRHMVQIVPGILLAFMEAAVLAALSVAISTRLPLLANFVICFSIYALGHLTPLVVRSSMGEFEPVAFVGMFLATLLPVLENFNIQAAVAGGSAVPYDYLLVSLVYCVLYATVAMLLALVLFEDRDLA
jgi:hypothetical protein